MNENSSKTPKFVCFLLYICVFVLCLQFSLNNSFMFLVMQVTLGFLGFVILLLFVLLS